MGRVCIEDSAGLSRSFFLFYGFFQECFPSILDEKGILRNTLINLSCELSDIGIICDIRVTKHDPISCDKSKVPNPSSHAYIPFESIGGTINIVLFYEEYIPRCCIDGKSLELYFKWTLLCLHPDSSLTHTDGTTTHALRFVDELTSFIDVCKYILVLSLDMKPFLIIYKDRGIRCIEFISIFDTSLASFACSDIGNTFIRYIHGDILLCSFGCARSLKKSCQEDNPDNTNQDNDPLPWEICLKSIASIRGVSHRKINMVELILRNNCFYNGIGSIFSFWYTESDGVTNTTFMKCYRCHENIVGLGFCIDLIFFSIFCNNPNLCFIRNLTDDLVLDFPVWLDNSFELTSLNEK
jgi:hypothetical protein